MSRIELRQQDHARASGKHEFGNPERIHVEERGGHQQAVTVLIAGTDACSDCPKLTVMR